MARSGLYKTDVQRARDALLAQGKRPSVDAVRVALGNTGSKTTIHRYLRELEEEEGQGPGTHMAISQALQDLVGRLAARLQEEADAIVAQARQRHETQLQETQQALSGIGALSVTEICAAPGSAPRNPRRKSRRRWLNVSCNSSRSSAASGSCAGL